MVATITLITVTNSRSRIVERDGVDHVLMAFESKKLRSTVNVPNFTSSVVASRQASVGRTDDTIIRHASNRSILNAFTYFLFLHFVLLIDRVPGLDQRKTLLTWWKF